MSAPEKPIASKPVATGGVDFPRFEGCVEVYVEVSAAGEEFNALVAHIRDRTRDRDGTRTELWNETFDTKGAALKEGTDIAAYLIDNWTHFALTRLD